MERIPTSAWLGLIMSVVYWAAAPGGIQAGVFDELSTPLAHEILRYGKSAAMRNLMNTSVHPCEDFYTYACGNYGEINPATLNADQSIYHTLNAGYLLRVKQLLEQPRLSTDRPMETRIKYFHESCLNSTARSEQRAHLLQILRQFGGMPALEGDAWRESQFDAIELMAKLLRHYGKITLLGVQVAPDYVNSQINRLYLGQRNDLISTKDESAYLVHQLELELRLREMLGLSAELAHRTALEIVGVERELAIGSLDQHVEHDPRVRNRLSMLSALSETYGPSLNLTHFVEVWLGHEYHLPVYEHVASYLWQLKKVLSRTPKPVLANYMLSTLLKDFEVGSGQEFCVQKTAQLLPDVVDHMVYRLLELRNPHIPGSLRQLWKELKLTFEEMIRQPTGDWLEEATRNEMLDKLKSMTFQIAGAESVDFEERYGSLIISSADYFGNIQRLLEMRALNLRDDLQRPSNPNYYEDMTHSPFYITELNRVILPPSYMQRFYFWDDVYPTALNYATLGFTLAHELAHGFDDYSRMYDGKGNLRDWWTHAAQVEFNARKSCFVEQFSELRYNGLKLPKMEFQDENIADNIGVRTAYTAYTNWLQQPTHGHVLDAETLPHLKHTPQQLFFLSLAQTLCSDIWPERRNSYLISDLHAPDEVRVFAIMANMKEFSNVFECRNNSQMNPQRKCSIY